MGPQQTQYALDAKFSALADSTRRSLVERLSRGQSSVKDLARPIPMSLPTVLKHLAILERGGIVQSEKRGRVRTFRIAPHAFTDMERWVAGRKESWNQALNRLGEFLGEP
jgi:DNA-binding transcriptional ArsR family regulator